MIPWWIALVTFVIGFGIAYLLGSYALTILEDELKKQWSKD